MPKVKTHSGSKKRFRVKSSGKIKRGVARKSHNLDKNKKSTKAKRGLNRPKYVSKSNMAAVKKLLVI